jgi:predicted dehydrogenase
MKTAILGVGRMGQRHIQVARDLNLELAGICDQNPETLSAVGKEHGIPAERQFEDVRALLEKARPECVVIATTAPTHSEYTCLAAEARARYILCEKPMAVSLAECDHMLKVCRHNHAKLAINHQMRFMEQYTEPKRIIEGEAFGGLKSVTVVAGNFGMAMNGTHYFEMFRYMTDEAPVEVTAWFSEEKVSNPRGAQFEDRAGSVRITTASGKRFYMDISANQGHGMKVIYAGAYGQIIVDEISGDMYADAREEQYRDLPATRYGMPRVATSGKIAPADAVAPTRAVLEALLKDKNAPDGEDGRLAVAVLVAAYFSDENGHVPVRLDDSRLPRERVFPWA